MNKELNVRIISHPTITESGVYDATFEVNREVVEREFEVGINASYQYESDTNYYNLRGVIVTATCCNEEDEDVADIMECKLEEAIEHYIWSVSWRKRSSVVCG